MIEANDPRRDELLQLARQSRLKWVLDAREVPKKQAEDPVEKASFSSAINVSDALKAKIPAADCVQKVLNFLSELKNDGECFDVESIALGIIDEDENDQELIEFMKNANTFSSVDQKDTVAMYNMFIKKLVQASSTEIVKQIQQFVTKFTTAQKNGRYAQQKKGPNFSGNDILKDPLEVAASVKSSEIWTFLDHIYELMLASSYWKDESESQFEHSKGYCEKFLFIKLHGLLFGTDLEDSYNNQKTRERIESLGFLTAEHLDIRCLKNSPHYTSVYQQQQRALQQQKTQTEDSLSSLVEQVLLQKPIAALRELEHVKCPADKIQCVKNCTMAIAHILKECCRDGKASGTDDFLPLMILTIRHCNPVHIHSNLKYLQRYTRPNKIMSEAGYLLTNFVSAVHFLDNVDSKALTIEPDEFDRAIARSRALAMERNRQQEASSASAAVRQQQQQPVARAATADGEEEAEDLDDLLTEHYRALGGARKQSQLITAREVAARRARHQL